MDSLSSCSGHANATAATLRPLCRRRTSTETPTIAVAARRLVLVGAVLVPAPPRGLPQALLGLAALAQGGALVLLREALPLRKGHWLRRSFASEADAGAHSRWRVEGVGTSHERLC